MRPMDRDDPMTGARNTELARLRAWRVRDRDRSASTLFQAMGERLARQARRGGAAGDAWEACCPPDLLGRTRVEGLRGGVLTVIAADAPTRYALERALRAGVEEAVIRAAAAPIRRVRVRLGA